MLRISKIIETIIANVKGLETNKIEKIKYQIKKNRNYAIFEIILHVKNAFNWRIVASV